ncbi:unnamed protein product, partial [Allacma fusca]
KLSQSKISCTTLNVTERCEHNPDDGCCSAYMDYYDWEDPGIGKYLVRMIAVGLACLLILAALETRLFSMCKRLIISFINRKKFRADFDVDVLSETRRIETSSMMTLNLTDNLIVKYGNILFKRIS